MADLRERLAAGWALAGEDVRLNTLTMQSGADPADGPANATTDAAAGTADDEGPRPVGKGALAFLAVVIGLSVMTLYAAATPWNDWGILFLAGPSWLVVGAIWLVAFVVALTRASGPRPVWRHWLVAPLVVILTLGAMSADLPVRVGLEASRGAFDDMVAAGNTPDTHAGWYDVTDFQATDFGFQFTVSCAGLIWCSGFAYSPNGAPGPETRVLQEGVTAYWHVDGPWYEWALRYT